LEVDDDTINIKIWFEIWAITLIYIAIAGHCSFLFDNKFQKINLKNADASKVFV
jgi:hypothetical protein